MENKYSPFGQNSRLESAPSYHSDSLMAGPSSAQTPETTCSLTPTERIGLSEAPQSADNLEVAQKNSYDWAISNRDFNTDSANKLLVLIDGHSVYSPLFSGVFWDARDYLLEDLDPTLLWVDAFVYNNGGIAATVPSYAEMNVRLGWHIRADFELSVTGQNLLPPYHLEYVIPPPEAPKSVGLTISSKILRLADFPNWERINCVI